MKEQDFNELLTSVQEAVQISKGNISPSRSFKPTPANVAAIRKGICKSQVDFAHMIGVSVGTLRNWEQGRRYPQGAAVALLKLVSASPEYAAQILSKKI